MKPVKFTIIIVFIALLSFSSFAQQGVYEQVRSLYTRVNGQFTDSLVREALDRLYLHPDLLNDIFKNQLEKLKDPGKQPWKFIRDLNIRFKTFQSDSLPLSLGFSYRYDNTWLKNKITSSSIFYQALNLSFHGNVAFKKEYNPNDFLESSMSYDAGWMWGGQPRELNEAQSEFIEEMEDSILARRSQGNLTSDLYEKVDSLVQVSDQFFLSVKAKFSF